MASVGDGAGRVCMLFGKRHQIQVLEQQQKEQVGSGQQKPREGLGLGVS